MLHPYQGVSADLRSSPAAERGVRYTDIEMISIPIIEKLENSNTPFNLEKEIELARKQGLCEEYINSISITTESKLIGLGVPSKSDFFKIHSKIKGQA